MKIGDEADSSAYEDSSREAALATNATIEDGIEMSAV